MKKMIFLALVGILMASTAFGQKDETLFSKLKLTGAWGGTAFNFAQVGEGYTTLQGGYGGLEFGKNFFVGYGGLASIGDFDINDGSNDRYRLDYSGLILGYSPKSYKTIHLQTSVLLGGGNVRNIGTANSDDFLAIQPYLGVELNIVRWMRIGIGGGYRAVFADDNIASSANLSNAFAEVKFKFGWSWGR
jgi:hypothetical protein